MELTLTTLLKLQLLYCGLGMGYNFVSYVLARSGRRKLSPTPPHLGAAFMFIYGLCLIPGWMDYRLIYRALMAFFLVYFGNGGVIRHVKAYPKRTKLYASTTAWLSAISINMFGVLLNLVAAIGFFQ